jgi:acyl dehydratase
VLYRISPIHIHRWGVDPFSHGSYSFALPGCADCRQTLAEPVDDRLFFAGEACSRRDFSTAHGAFITGIAAADRVIALRTQDERGVRTATVADNKGPGVMIEWFDDLVLGMRFKSPDKQVTREDIKRFASEFDPQPYHLDETAAERTPLKGLAASGWHTAAIAMRLAVEVRPFGPHPLLGIGVDDLRWLAPVRPGDVIHLEGEVVELTPSKTKPQGVVRVKWTAFNQHGDPVYTFTPIGVVPRRPSGSAAR